MAPLKPCWKQPSHPDIQDVVVSGADFMTKSTSKVTVPPFGLFAKLEFPPCEVADEATYATVQMAKDEHLNLNSDLLYINHSCEPSLHFDMGNMKIVAGPKGLRPGDELTFFYPSTEWSMAQPFSCFCGKPTCKEVITGAKDMPPQQLEGLWLNDHIHELLEEQASQESPAVDDRTKKTNGTNAGVAITGLGLVRRGVTSREMSGEMGGDTVAQARC
ncbi:post-set domain-containing [Trichoderma cornu-damae]|uniref:Post-set domain-containing n=1 Tax=Trichoderma cornu-damae TaxID=654480 RepID=A0A9P8QM48_9HYPO|nr:post-set domain-containing [Trichoderma cornu-damae]